jgi:hypothetical protein
MSSNEQVAAKLEGIAQMMELLGEDGFRVNAHNRAARAVSGLAEDVATLAKDRDALIALDGVGPKTADKIIECVKTGTIAEYEELMAKVPQGLRDILQLPGLGPKTVRAMWQTLGVDTRLVKIAGFAMTAAVAGAVGAAMSVRWTYIDPPTVFNPFIGFQTVLIALIGGAVTLWGPLIAAVVFSLLAETLRLAAPQVYMMTLGLLLILCVLYLPGGLASLRWDTWKLWRDDMRAWWRERRYEWSGDKARDKRLARERRLG